MVPIWHLVSAQRVATGALTTSVSVTLAVEENSNLPFLYFAGGIVLLSLGIWQWLRQGRLRAHAIYRAWIPFDHRDAAGVAGKRGRPVLILEELGDRTVLVLEGTSKATGYGTRLNIGTGGWSSRRDVTIRRETYLRTDRCLRIPRGFIELDSGPHLLPKHLLDQVLLSERPPIENRLTTPSA